MTTSLLLHWQSISHFLTQEHYNSTLLHVVSYTKPEVPLVSIVNFQGEVVRFRGWQFTFLIQQVKYTMSLGLNKLCKTYMYMYSGFKNKNLNSLFFKT